MKILHVIGTFNNGGIENLLVNLTRQQVLQGNVVGLMIITDSCSQSMIRSLHTEVKVLFVGKPEGNHNPYYFLKINWMYHRYNPDVLHLHSPSLNALFRAFNSKEKRFAHIHNVLPGYKYSPLVNRYLAISKCVFDVYQRNIGNDKCTILYNGIDFSKLSEKEMYNINPIRIVCVGRMLFNTKGQDVLLTAFERLLKIRKDVRLDFWGGGTDLYKLREMVSEKELAEYVQIAGDVDNTYVNSHLKEYDLAVYASRHEGLGLAAIEAMGVGVPVLLSDVDGHKEVSEGGQYATMFEVNNVNSLVDALLYVLDNYHHARVIAEKAKIYVRNKFSIEVMANQLSSIYQSF